MKSLKKFVICVGILFLSTGLFAKDWFVCVGSYSSPENAQELVDALQRKGVTTFIYEFTKDNGGKLYRVLVDELFVSRDKARVRRDILEDNAAITSLGITGLWICQAEKPVPVVDVPVINVPVVNEPIAKTPIVDTPVFDASVPEPVFDESIKIVLSWNNQELDLDSTLVTASLQIDFENPEQEGISLDYDEEADYAPETITINKLNKSEVYRYFVEDYDNYYDSDSTALADSGAVVKVFQNGECIKTYNIFGLNGTTWHVFDIVNGEFVLINEVNNDEVTF